MTLSHLWKLGCPLCLEQPTKRWFLAESLLFLKPSFLLMSKPFLCCFLLFKRNLSFSSFISSWIISDIWYLIAHPSMESQHPWVNCKANLSTQTATIPRFPTLHLATQTSRAALYLEPLGPDRMVKISDPVDRVNLILIVVRKLQVTSPAGSCESSGHPQLMVRNHDWKDFSFFA